MHRPPRLIVIADALAIVKALVPTFVPSKIPIVMMGPLSDGLYSQTTVLMLNDQPLAVTSFGIQQPISED